MTAPADLTLAAQTRNIHIVAARTVEGTGLQILDIYKDGQHVHRLRHRGTVRQATAKALLDHAHDTDPDFPALLAALHDQE